MKGAGDRLTMTLAKMVARSAMAMTMMLTVILAHAPRAAEGKGKKRESAAAARMQTRAVPTPARRSRVAPSGRETDMSANSNGASTKAAGGASASEVKSASATGTVADAQDGTPGAGADSNGANGTNGAMPGGATKTAKTKVYTFGAMDVEGKLKTPQLLYFLNRVKLELEMSAPDHRSFMKELEKTAEDNSL